MLPTIPSSIKDTNDFLQSLRATGPLPPDSLLVTLDVSTLYPSIPHNDGLSALRSFLQDRRYSPVFIEGIIQLTQFVLSKNYFTFEDEIYPQKSGTAIGTVMAVVYSIIFMDNFERTAMDSFALNIHTFLRFIDDIFD